MIWENAGTDVTTDNIIKVMNRLDMYDSLPSGMRKYLSRYGWHFSRKMCEWAVSRMKAKDQATGKDKRIEPFSKEDVESILSKYGVELGRDAGYDSVFAANMCKADYYKSSVPDEAHIAKFIKDYVDDPDGYDGLPFTRFYADCIGGGTPILWNEML